MGSRGSKPLVETGLVLRVRDLRGVHGFFGSHQITAADGTVIRFRPDVGEAHGWVHVEHWPVGAEWATLSYDVSLFARAQHFGGVRWLLSCPMSGVLTSVLYLPIGADRFASRQAHGLAFASQRLRAPARATVRGAADPPRPRRLG